MPCPFPSFFEVTDQCYLKQKVHPWLSNHYILSNALAFVCGFTIYFSMYAYRKTYTASKYEGYKIFKISYKLVLIILQLIGYIISKFSGIVIISGLQKQQRAFLIMTLTLIAEATLILFGIVPPPYNAIFMFFNGLPLGLFWGIVYSYLEGRKTSELLGAGMCISFIVSSGAVKSIGAALVNYGVANEFWMPALVGAIFFPIMVLFTFLIEMVPPPTKEDIESRVERVAMTHEDRMNFLKTFGPGVVVMIIFSMVTTSYRDFRDNFTPEIFSEMNVNKPGIYAYSELIVAAVIVVACGLLMLMKDNMKAFISYHFMIACALIIFGVITFLYDKLNKINGVVWMILSGIALYIAYVPYNSMIFDRQIAAFKAKANSGFLIYFADSIGYLASSCVMFVKEFGPKNLHFLGFFKLASYVYVVFGVFCQIFSIVYYWYKYKSMHIKERELEENLKADSASQEDTSKVDSSKTNSSNDQAVKEESDSGHVIAEL